MKKTFHVKGMHCNSCSSLIEKVLKDKVNSVSASYSNETVTIDFDPDKISEKDINTILEKEGYSLSEKEAKKVSPDKIIKIIFSVCIGIIALLAIYYFFISSGINLKLPEINLPEVGQNTSLVLLFLIGLLTGFHCISMCGGFVVSYTAKNAIKGHKGFTQHLVYGGSKVISYTIIGALFGLIGGIFAFSIGLRGWIAILAGIFMIFYSLSMLGIRFFKKFQFNPKFLTKFAASESSKFKGPYSRPMITGLLNGLFIACGPLQAMYLYAAGTGSLVSGALSLAAFGLGTLPVMIGFGSLATAISHKTTKKILKLSAIIVLILGLIMLNRGLTLTGSSLSFDSLKSKIIVTNISAGAASIQSGNSQIINMNVDSSGYTPNSFVLKQGVPVQWNINVNQLTGCNSELVANSYGIDIKLKQGLNTVTFTPDKTGTIQFSCGMGMLHGSFIVTETGTASLQQINSATQTKGSTCGMAKGSCGCMG